MLKEIALAAGGMIAGLLVGYKIGSTREARDIEEQLESIRQFYYDKYSGKLDKEDETVEDDIPQVEYCVPMNKFGKPDCSVIPDEPVPDNNCEIICWGDTLNEDYEQHCLRFYAKDEVWVDDEDAIVDDIEDFLGKYESLDVTDNRARDLYLGQALIRNHKLKTDFEIVYMDRAYGVDILGMDDEDEDDDVDVS